MAGALHNGQWTFNPYHQNILNCTYPTANYTKAISNVALYKRTTQLFMVFHREHNTHMLCEMEKFTNIWSRRPQQDFILPPNIRLHRHPHCPNSWKSFYQTYSVLTCRNCTVCQTCSWCCMEGISLLITPATIWSPIYPDLWMCLVRDSGLFTFLAQILIWSYSVAVLSQLY